MTNADARREDHCTHLDQTWCDCDWCRINHHWTPKPYVARLSRTAKTGQWWYFTSGPQGGGFGTNMGSGVPMGSTIRAAIANIPAGAAYELVIHGRSRGVFTCDGRNPLSGR